MSDHKIHPAAELLPNMAADQFEDLLNDIKTNGMIEPIVLYGKLIIDGRHRYRACEQLGRVPSFVELDQELHPDPIAYVLSTNLHRRHLTAGQRALVATNAVSISHGGKRRGFQDANLPLENATAKVASQLNVSPRSVTTARSILSSGNQEVIDALSAGEMTLHKASQKIKGHAGDSKAGNAEKDSKRHARKAKKLIEAARRSADDHKDLAHPSDYESLDKGLTHVWNILNGWIKQA
ncbi:ParB/RepB/Spo0J family partition protein [Rhodopirellula baltica]